MVQRSCVLLTKAPWGTIFEGWLLYKGTQKQKEGKGYHPRPKCKVKCQTAPFMGLLCNGYASAEAAPQLPTSLSGMHSMRAPVDIQGPRVSRSWRGPFGHRHPRKKVFCSL